MKKKFILFSLLTTLLFGCCACDRGPQTITPPTDTTKIEYTQNKETIGDFDLVSPANGSEVVKDIPTFTWTLAANATSYELELCDDSKFIDDEDTTYIKKTNICSTEYTLDVYLKSKEKLYYWRVTAVNKQNRKLSSTEYRSFYLKSPDYGEIEFDIDYADEWEVHKEGSQADVSIDKSDFFNNGKNSLAISFDETVTNIGVPESDGWIVITHNQETELYGVDAFYFNFYYNGQDAKVYLRVVDEDNEYWNAEIKLATNAQQVIILKFDEFTLRTKGGTPIANKVFDYNYIKSIELVFEQTFGDGICMVSNLKAIKTSDYSHLFLSQVDFNDFNPSEFIYENYNGFNSVVSDEGKTFTVSYGGDINGYGFLKVLINKTLISGDSFTVKISHTGSKNHQILFRVIEEDGDRWVYRQKCSTLLDEEITIPFNAFTLSEANGDGARQFYFIKQFQFGIENTYEQGSVTYSNFRVTTLKDEVDDLYVNEIEENGLIENFDSYATNCDMYYRWQNTVINKDEAMAIDSQYTAKGIGYCGKFTYKSDMYPACYGKEFNNGVEGYNAIKFDCLDKSVLKNTTGGATSIFDHLGSSAAKLQFTIYVADGSTYSYVINSLDQVWTTYEIPFTLFELDEGFSPYQALPLTSENLKAIRFGFQFYYYNVDGKANPQYTSNNPVYLDNIYLINTDDFNKYEVSDKIKPLPTDANTAVIDDFENITDSNINTLFGQNDDGYSKLTVGESYDGGKSLTMQYQGNQASVSYVRMVTIDSEVQAKALRFDLKGDDKATVYINLFLEYAGNTYKYRATLNNVSSEWTTYTIGFDSSNFVKIEGTGNLTISSKMMCNINKITIGIVNYKDNNLSTISIDNTKLVYSGVSYSTKTATKIGG